MLVQKRNGKIVDYQADKIRQAILKANAEVAEKERISEQTIEDIIAYVEQNATDTMAVEQIQDIIESKLVELNKYVLAKTYIIYRYTRALVRKQNTTDESILQLLNNEN